MELAEAKVFPTTVASGGSRTGAVSNGGGRPGPACASVRARPPHEPTRLGGGGGEQPQERGGPDTSERRGPWGSVDSNQTRRAGRHGAETPLTCAGDGAAPGRAKAKARQACARASSRARGWASFHFSFCRRRCVPRAVGVAFCCRRGPPASDPPTVRARIVVVTQIGKECSPLTQEQGRVLPSSVAGALAPSGRWPYLPLPACLAPTRGVRWVSAAARHTTVPLDLIRHATVAANVRHEERPAPARRLRPHARAVPLPPRSAPPRRARHPLPASQPSPAAGSEHAPRPAAIHMGTMRSVRRAPGVWLTCRFVYASNAMAAWDRRSFMMRAGRSGDASSTRRGD
ncbi:hypothetical protein SETIT_1G241400v2 [Setaria italica]|uniref:Uncharacterized protein n=1 Tax=Setaria italica TaxID=4555 RepID=A0A368PP08_SETIT|nr:hypothetical protein SETIT_1G241400v2 [Setaria italica]